MFLKMTLPASMDEWRKIHKSICWFAESGIYKSSDLVSAIETKLDFKHHNLHDIVKIFFLGFAERKLASVQLLESLQRDYIIIPTVDPHHFARYLEINGDDRKGIKPEIGETIQFNVWDGNNAPAELSQWSGIITDKVSNGILMEYIILRNEDKEKIKLPRKYIVKRIKREG
jgi:hypothetical protein